MDLQAGHPVIDVDWKYDPTAKETVVTLKQVQDTSDGTPIYDLPLTVGFLLPNTPMQTTRFRMTGAEYTVHFPGSVKPDAVLIDPDHDLLKELKINYADSETRAILTRATCLIDRQNALRRLTEGDAELDAKTYSLIADAAAKEENDGFASTLLGVLRNSKEETYRALYRTLARDKKRPLSRSAALRNLAAMPFQSEDEALFADAAKSDTEYYSIVEAGLTGLKPVLKTHLDLYKHQALAKSRNDRLTVTALNLLSTMPFDESARCCWKSLRTRTQRCNHGDAP